MSDDAKIDLSRYKTSELASTVAEILAGSQERITELVFNANILWRCNMNLIKVTFGEGIDGPSFYITRDIVCDVSHRSNCRIFDRFADAKAVRSYGRL